MTRLLECFKMQGTRHIPLKSITQYIKESANTRKWYRAGKINRLVSNKITASQATARANQQFGFRGQQNNLFHNKRCTIDPALVCSHARYEIALPTEQLKVIAKANKYNLENKENILGCYFKQYTYIYIADSCYVQLKDEL